MMINVTTAKSLAWAGLLMTVCSAAIFLVAFRAGAKQQRGPEWRLMLISISLFFLGGILLIFGIVSREVAHSQTGG